jgi:hypothetical protein
MVGVRMTKKVLIVEDNELNMKLFHDLLEARVTRPCRPVRVCRRCRSPGIIAPT